MLGEGCGRGEGRGRGSGGRRGRAGSIRFGRRGRGQAAVAGASSSAAGAVPPAPAAPAPPTPRQLEEAAPPTTPAPSSGPAAAALEAREGGHRRDPDVLEWSSGGLSFAFTRRRGPNQGWIARCCCHPADVGSRGAALPCTRELSEQALLRAQPSLAGADLSEAVLRQLKFWCIDGVRSRSRIEHTDVRLFSRYTDPSALPSLAALDESLAAHGAASR